MPWWSPPIATSSTTARPHPPPSGPSTRTSSAAATSAPAALGSLSTEVAASPPSPTTARASARPPPPDPADLLVSDYLSSEIEATGYVARVEREGAEYNGFNLLAGDARELHWVSNREGRPRRLGPGVYGLSNHLLDTPWPKVTAGKSGLEALLGGGEYRSRVRPLRPAVRQHSGPVTMRCPAPGSASPGSGCSRRRSSPRPSTARDRLL